MLRATRLLQAVAAPALASFSKKTTGITGLAVVPNAREVLLKLYTKTLRDVTVSG